MLRYNRIGRSSMCKESFPSSVPPIDGYGWRKLLEIAYYYIQSGKSFCFSFICNGLSFAWLKMHFLLEIVYVLDVGYSTSWSLWKLNKCIVIKIEKTFSALLTVSFVVRKLHKRISEEKCLGQLDLLWFCFLEWIPVFSTWEL